MKKPKPSPIFLYLNDIPQPFYSFAVCQLCGEDTLLYYPQGKNEDVRGLFFSECGECGQDGMAFTSAVTTGN